ncbi:hypothetical protein [Marinomonas ostreistagni]|uniref:Phage tail tape measure protein n=1 Tax=Marinomonas ostreistagni TaxID=359209 RepID=A0ABS0ZCQ9_9GAMM|nr:hypothetical protein [Marinomonas ostreistagni]MBJ7550731.1 hypothetical protein [Marinomonas ostreistagni]
MAINQRLNTVIEIGGAVSRTLFGATNKARGQLKGIGGAMDTIKRKQDQIERFDIKGLRETRKKLRGVEHNIAGLSDEIEKSKAKSHQAGLAYRRASERVNDMAREMKGAEDPTGALAHELDQAKREATRLEREFKAAKKETSGLQTQMLGAQSEANKLSRQFNEQREAAKSAKNALKEMGVDTRNLADETARLQRRQALLEKTQKSLGRVGDTFGNMTHQVGSFARTASVGLGIVGGGLFAVANSTSELGDQAAKTADKLGLQISALQELRYAAERSGVSSNTLDMAMQRMVRRLAEAKNGSGEAKGALEELGLSAQALTSMTPDEAMNEIADALKGVKSQSDRVRLAFKFFDSEGVSMVNMLKDGSAGLQQLRKDARDTGYVLSEQAARDAEAFQDSLLNAKLGMAGFKNTIGSAIMPVITDMMGEMSAWMRENRGQVVEFSQRLASGLRDAVPVIGQVVQGLTTTAKTIGSVTATIANMVGGYENLGMIVGTVFAGKAIMSVVSFAGSMGSMLLTVGKLVFTFGRFAMLLNPIGLVVGAVVGIGAALYTAYNKVEWFRDAVDGAFRYIGDTAKSIWDGVVAFFDSIPARVGAAVDKIKAKFQGIVSLGKSVGNFFGFGEDEEEPKQKSGGDWFGKNDESPAPAAPRVANARRIAQSVNNTHNTASTKTENRYEVSNQIVVNQQPGQNARELATEIERILRQKMRGSLSDQPSGAF